MGQHPRDAGGRLHRADPPPPGPAWPLSSGKLPELPREASFCCGLAGKEAPPGTFWEQKLKSELAGHRAPLEPLLSDSRQVGG